MIVGSWSTMNGFYECWLYSLNNGRLSNDFGNWLGNNSLLDEWFTLNLSVESVDWISCVVNCTLVAISIDERIVSFNNISVSCFVL